jgi:hypothetical protein
MTTINFKVIYFYKGGDCKMAKAKAKKAAPAKTPAKKVKKK